MGALTLQAYAAGMGIDMAEATAAEHVKTFRTTYPGVPELWNQCERAAKLALTGRISVALPRGVNFRYKPERGNYLQCTLPSGRQLFFLKPRLENQATRYGMRETIIYASAQGTSLHQRSIYGAKLVENIVQAIARDILAEAMVRVDRHPMPIVLTVHDEIVVQVEDDWNMEPEDLKFMMEQTPEWAEDLPLAVEAHRGNLLRKVRQAMSYGYREIPEDRELREQIRMVIELGRYDGDPEEKVEYSLEDKERLRKKVEEKLKAFETEDISDLL